ncbi:hypothetical protein CAPTEDRAFT_209731 [Capitella teleta]|uniref:Uncharacterized protein n=1 Tax=Capitella teleta TaxID=283909 RepID=R7TXP9_CAPTE|nr:hypothetical protein CAPTEDRAFT_209731 [Capitella teleta]|eukprot:ELT96221.1 hypothetical protein CAPTEDRAFT_209731 [Capitella teleta]
MNTAQLKRGGGCFPNARQDKEMEQNQVSVSRLCISGTHAFTAFCTHTLDECSDLRLGMVSHSSLREKDAAPPLASPSFVLMGPSEASLAEWRGPDWTSKGAASKADYICSVITGRTEGSDTINGVIYDLPPAGATANQLQWKASNLDTTLEA